MTTVSPHSRYLIISGPADFTADLLSLSEQGVPENKGLRVAPDTSRRGDWVQDVIALIGFISSVGGLITFVDWGVAKWRARNAGEDLTFVVVDEAGDEYKVVIKAGDDGATIRRKLTEALSGE